MEYLFITRVKYLAFPVFICLILTCTIIFLEIWKEQTISTSLCSWRWSEANHDWYLCI